MPIGSLLTAKEQASGYQPLLLCVVTFSDGTVLRLSTHDQTGGAAYGGNDYLPYILNKEIAGIALGEQGIDVPTSVTLRLADSDFYLWSNFEKLHGFKGAQITLTAVLYDVLAGGYSSDARVIFRGICREPGGKLPEHDGKVLTVGFASRLNMADAQIPTIRVQKTCPWIFPSTLAERQAGADEAGSVFFPCGYSPDATGGNARGNLVGGVPATTCNYTKANCVERGMYTQDSAARITGRFGGIQWNPPEGKQTVRNYISGKHLEVQAQSNEARYGDYIPLLFGRSWTDPLILNTIPDGNFVRMEALICFGEVEEIIEVVVNDATIPHIYGDTEAPVKNGPGVPNKTEASKGGWWKCTNRGDRDGAPTNDAGYTNPSGVPQGDPYGSYCVLEIVVPHAVASPGSFPRVRVYAERGSGRPSDQIAEILQNWAGWELADLNATSFSAAAALDDVLIPYTNPFGAGGTRKRFTSSLYLRQRESVADVVRGLRNCRRGILVPDEAGLLLLKTEQTLADQQPAPVTGSNYVTAVSSKTAGGVPTNGYVAYRFDESNILEPPVMRLITAGNRYSIQFPNAENRHSIDSFQPIDSEDIVRSDQEIPGSFSIRGADNYDLIRALLATYTAKQFRGNWRGDTGGSLVMEFPASFKAVHLGIGDICMLNWEPLGIANQLFRVVRITPETDFERARVALAWHDDDWYVDTYGQNGQPGHTSRFRDRLARPAFPWLPFEQQPAAGDSLYDTTEWGFAVSQRYELEAAGESSLAKVAIGGKQPVNVTLASPAPPFVPLQGNTASTGGTIAGGRSYYAALVALDSGGGLSSLSPIITIQVPAGTNTNTITVPNINWDPAAAGYQIYVGTNPNALSYQDGAFTTPSSITLTSLSVALSGAPDGEFDRFRFRVKRQIHGGLWGAEVVSVTSTTIQIAVGAPGFTANQWAGYDLTWIGQRDALTPLPIASFRIASNTSDTLTLAGGAPDPAALGMGLGSVVVMRAKPTVGTDATGTYLEDLNWQNAFHPDGMTADAEVGYLIRFIAGTGRGQVVRVKANTVTRHYGDFPVTPDGTSRYIIEEPTWKVIKDTDSISNNDTTAPMTADVDVTNLVGQTLLVQALTLDGGDAESVEALSPIREIYMDGRGLKWITVTEDTELTGDDLAVAVDTSGGPVSLTLAPIASGRSRGRKVIVKKITGDANAVTILPAAGNTIDGGATFQLVDEHDSVILGGDGA